MIVISTAIVYESYNTVRAGVVRRPSESLPSLLAETFKLSRPHSGQIFSALNEITIRAIRERGCPARNLLEDLAINPTSSPLPYSSPRAAAPPS